MSPQYLDSNLPQDTVKNIQENTKERREKQLIMTRDQWNVLSELIIAKNILSFKGKYDDTVLKMGKRS